MGSASAATVMDLLSAIQPKACLFLGKCGGLKTKNKIGDLILPIAAIRGEGTSNDYFPPEVPALPAFSLQKAISTTIRNYQRDYWTGTVYTTNRRVWEHDDEFKKYLRRIRCMAIDMETATDLHNRFPQRNSHRRAARSFRINRWCPKALRPRESDQQSDRRIRRTAPAHRNRFPLRTNQPGADGEASRF